MADVLRSARLTTLRRSLEAASERAVNAFLIAGDLFEDNQVDEKLVAEVVQIFGEFPSLPIYLLPGNHDPASGPEAVWNREALREAPANVHILHEAGVVDLGGAWLLASPLHQKVSSTDPSQKLVELAAEVPADAIKIGITHGALAIEGRHQPNDFPIALNAASRAGLDYLAVGHWHNWLADFDHGRIVMPGTPEPDQFDQERSGNVALVEIEGPGQPSRVEPLSVANLHWKTLAFDFHAAESSRATLEQSLAALRSDAERTVLRIALSGTASPSVVAGLREWLDAATKEFLTCQVADSTRVALDEAELHDLRNRHPILAQVLADIDQLETLATGRAPAPAAPPEETMGALSLAEAQTLLGGAKIDLANLDAPFFGQLRLLTLAALQEVTR
jgi:DNA repair exonuclease SbcCD nuclease subunit